MSQYRKKPVVVEAFEVTHAMVEAHLLDGVPFPPGLITDYCSYQKAYRVVHRWHGRVETIHGEWAGVVVGDWVATEPDGEHHYPIKPDIFAATYEPADVPTPNSVSNSAPPIEETT